MGMKMFDVDQSTQMYLLLGNENGNLNSLEFVVLTTNSSRLRLPFSI